MTKHQASQTGIIGHSAVLKFLDQAWRQDRIHQAYLFTGPAHVGKNTLARWFIKKLLCLADGAPDCPCDSCVAFTAGRHIDFIQMARTDTGDKIGVDQVRSFQDSVRRRPGIAQRVVGLIDSIDQSSESAMNALLKILEEPPAGAVIILLSDQSDRILPTIKSRCQLISLQPVAPPELSKALQTRGLTKSDSLASARLAGGCPGLALRWQADPQLQIQQTDLAKMLIELNRLKLADRLEQVKKILANDRASFSDSDEHLIDLWLLITREMLLTKLELRDLAVYRSLTGLVGRAADSTELSKLSEFTRHLWRGLERVRRNVNPGLNFGNLSINV